jgi:ribosomal protein S6--L-glutamate ligase
MILSFHPCFTADHQIILGDRSLNEADRRLIRSAHAVILPQGRADGVFHECQNAGAPMFPNYEMRHAYPGKVGQSRLFHTFQLPHPRTFRWRRVDLFKKVPRPPHEFPFVVKDDGSHEAEGVFVVTGPKSLKAALGFLALKEGGENNGFVTQDFVASGGNVLRSVIMGKQILTYWKRPVKPGQVITTISRGARIDHDWEPALQEKGKVQAQVLARRTGIDLAAVDFVFSLSKEDPGPLFLEINYFFGRRGLGGMDAFYRLLFRAIQDWLKGIGLDPETVELV